MTAAASLGQLCDALGRDDLGAALGHALAAWSVTRGDALAEIVVELYARIPARVPFAGANNLKRWQAAEVLADPQDIPRQVEYLRLDERQKVAMIGMTALAKRPANPMLARELAAMIAPMPYRSPAAADLYHRAIMMIAGAASPVEATSLRALAEQLPSLGNAKLRDQIAAWIEQATAQITARPQPSIDLTATRAALADHAARAVTSELGHRMPCMRPLLLLLLATGCAAASGDTLRTSDEAPLVIELFTSQGCSSCPPADALLGKLAAAGQSDGRPIVALSFHVDYWNDLGWADPFSTQAWTQRQQQYSRALGEDRVYTPELVVGGAAGMVGSQATTVARAIAAAPKQLPITASATWSADSVTIAATAPDGADIWVAVWQDAAKTKVTSGENAGEAMLGDRVVRKLERVAASGRTAKLAITLPATWRAGGAVAFAQRPDKKIVGARLLAR